MCKGFRAKRRRRQLAAKLFQIRRKERYNHMIEISESFETEKIWSE